MSHNKHYCGISFYKFPVSAEKGRGWIYIDLHGMALALTIKFMNKFAANKSLYKVTEDLATSCYDWQISTYYKQDSV